MTRPKSRTKPLNRWNSPLNSRLKLPFHRVKKHLMASLHPKKWMAEVSEEVTTMSTDTGQELLQCQNKSQVRTRMMMT